ncbi:hypothetical protein NDU88_000087 [Pleurodeles waltl]|uniref:Uncharacterized protein n=1 Tax=Pleurodeles waltl TaxID=8319 RepID=A0AAV7TEJ4_PLEWA|nr:hypothetical protein NDU88_000087 [Pleurodeles waltl]
MRRPVPQPGVRSGYWQWSGVGGPCRGRVPGPVETCAWPGVKRVCLAAGGGPAGGVGAGGPSGLVLGVGPLGSLARVWWRRRAAAQSV